MRVVLDTDVLVSALRSRTGASHRILLTALDGGLTLLASVAIFLEYEDVLTRPGHLTAAGYTRAKMRDFLHALSGIVVPVVSHYQWRPSIRDPDDEMFVEAAINGQADAIVTFNRKDYRALGSLLLPESLVILRPGELLRRL